MNLRRAFCVLSASLTLSFAAASPAHATSILVYESSGATGTLWDLDSTTVTLSNPRPTLGGLVGIEFGTTGTLFGLSDSSSPIPNSLFSLNTTTGAATPIGSTGISTVLEGALALDPTTGLLWGAYGLATPNAQFFTLNTVTGAATLAFTTPIANTDFSAMSFDAAGNLFVVNTQTTADSLLRIDKATGAILQTLALTDGSSPANLTNGGMDFDPVSGQMFITDAGTKVLYTLNTNTGALTFLSTNSLLANDARGLTVVPVAPTAVPEPTSLLLLATGAAGLRLLRRRRPQ